MSALPVAVWIVVGALKKLAELTMQPFGVPPGGAGCPADAPTRMRLRRIRQAERITMLLVNYDVEEAVFLADCVVVMSPRPGRITAVRDIKLPRPRARVSADFVVLKSEIRACLVED